MFGAPLLITGLLYFAFGGRTSGTGTFTLPVTRVQVVNLDQPVGAAPGFAAGTMLVDVLQGQSLSDVLAVTLASDEASARTAVDEQQAGVAIIIPPDFTAAATSPDRSAAVVIYRDPTLTIGPGIVKDLVSHVHGWFLGGEDCRPGDGGRAERGRSSGRPGPQGQHCSSSTPPGSNLMSMAPKVRRFPGWQLSRPPERPSRRVRARP